MEEVDGAGHAAGTRVRRRRQAAAVSAGGWMVAACRAQRRSDPGCCCIASPSAAAQARPFSSPDRSEAVALDGRGGDALRLVRHVDKLSTAPGLPVKGPQATRALPPFPLLPCGCFRLTARSGRLWRLTHGRSRADRAQREPPVTLPRWLAARGLRNATALYSADRPTLPVQSRPSLTCLELRAHHDEPLRQKSPSAHADRAHLASEMGARPFSSSAFSPAAPRQTSVCLLRNSATGDHRLVTSISTRWGPRRRPAMGPARRRRPRCRRPAACSPPVPPAAHPRRPLPPRPPPGKRPRCCASTCARGGWSW